MAANGKRVRRRRDWRRMLLAGVTVFTIGAMYLGIIKTWFPPESADSGAVRLVATAAVRPAQIR
ncbi:hypothetical protein [Geomesophilobacter sediminis]|uniref:Uncharacterized protein n=1 Tax=Geomesophilobacter sediminis TaxID=2798584 RepID=A0A8J7M1M4_9BACT|nr:hypothetical protein [Geomesophilobacter sediminis]MBJ6726838.1 hypothetical protein [Geomesophilobacter sediminis]